MIFPLHKWPLLVAFCVAVVVQHLSEMVKDWAAEKLKENPE